MANPSADYNPFLDAANSQNLAQTPSAEDNPFIAASVQNPSPPTSSPSTGASIGNNIANFAATANNTFYGGLLHGAANLVNLASPTLGAKINDFLNNRITNTHSTTIPGGSPSSQFSNALTQANFTTPSGHAGEELGNVLKGASEYVPTLLVGGPEGPGLLNGLGRAGVNGLTGAVLTGAETGDRKSTLESGVLSALIPGGAEIGSGIFKKVANPLVDKIGPSLYNSIVRTPTSQLQAGMSNIGEELYNRGFTGTYPTLVSKTQGLLDTSGKGIGAIIKTYGNVPVDATPLVKALSQLRAKLANTPGESTAAVDRVLSPFLKQVSSTTTDLTPGVSAKVPVTAGAVVNDIHMGPPLPGRIQTSPEEVRANIASSGKTYTVPADMTLSRAQQLKTNLDDALSQSQHLKDSVDNNGIVQAQQVAADALRKIIPSAVPDKEAATQLLQHNADYSFGSRAKSALISAGNQDSTVVAKAANVAKLISALGLAAAGHPLLGAGAVATQALDNPGVVTNALQVPKKSLSPEILNVIQKAGISLGSHL